MCFKSRGSGGEQETDLKQQQRVGLAARNGEGLGSGGQEVSSLCRSAYSREGAAAGMEPLNHD